jgi:cytoskeleton protein RodZ
MSDESTAQSVAQPDAPGSVLAQSRRARNLSIADVAERLKYAPRQIEALEADDHGRLPGPTFVRGMIRGYAKLLETDPTPLIKELERRNIPAPPSVNLHKAPIPFPEGSKRATRVYAALAILALVAAGAVLYEWRLGATAPWPQQVANTIPALLQAKPNEIASTAEGSEPPLRATTYAEASRLELEFQSESWVEIKDRGGQTLLSQLNPGGSKRTVEGLPPFSVVIGNAGKPARFASGASSLAVGRQSWCSR